MGNGSKETLTLSDWITFLSSEASPAMGNIIALGAFVVAASALVLSVTNRRWEDMIGAVVMVGALVWFFFAFDRRFGHRADKARELLDLIMKGCLKDPLQIQQAWKEFLDSEKQKRTKGKLFFKK